MKSDCDEQQLLRAVCYGTICLLTLGLLLECSITGVGLQGGRGWEVGRAVLTQHQSRQHGNRRSDAWDGQGCCTHLAILAAC